MDPIKKLMTDVKKRYDLKGYTQEQIKSWIAIEFKRMEEQNSCNCKLRIVDVIKEKKIRKLSYKEKVPLAGSEPVTSR